MEISLHAQAAKAGAEFELARQVVANAKADHFATAAAEATRLNELRVKLDSELAKTIETKEQLNANI